MSRPIFAHMVVRNEAGRYLQAVLRALAGGGVTHVHVYDDASTDHTVALAEAEGAVVTKGGADFLEHEGRCRFVAWLAFELAMAPEAGDWVLAVDADEILVTTDLAAEVEAAVAARPGVVSLEVPIPEVFDLDDGVPLIRTDGFWATLAQPRLFRYAPGGTFRDAPLACGSVPTYAARASARARDVQLLHLGYLDPADRTAKFNRYYGKAGHSMAHISSIVLPGRRKRWFGPHPPIWRGER